MLLNLWCKKEASSKLDSYKINRSQGAPQRNRLKYYSYLHLQVLQNSQMCMHRNKMKENKSIV